MNNTLHIKQEAIAPFGFKLFGSLMVVMGITVIYAQAQLMSSQAFVKPILFLLVGAIIIGGGLILITARFGFELDPKEKKYRIYTWLLGWRVGKYQHYQKIKQVYIKEAKQRKRASSTNDGSLFKAFIKFDDGEPLHFDTDQEEKQLNSRVEGYKKTLNL